MSEKNNSSEYNDPREILRDIFIDRGESILENPQLFRALFKDHSKGQFIRELNLLEQSFSENIPSELHKKKEHVHYHHLSLQFVKKLHETRGMQKELAEWVVESWVLIFNETTEGKTKNIQKTNSIFISSNPPGADIYLDRKKIGQTGLFPLIVSVASRNHTIICKLPGYQEGKETISLKKDTTVNFNLIEIAGPGHSVTITTSPQDADVYLDGILKGATPLTIPNVPENCHELLCSLKGYEDIKKQISVNSNTSVTYIFTKK